MHMISSLTLSGLSLRESLADPEKGKWLLYPVCHFLFLFFISYFFTVSLSWKKLPLVPHFLFYNDLLFKSAFTRYISGGGIDVMSLFKLPVLLSCSSF